MKIRCISIGLSEDKLHILGKHAIAKNYFSITVDKEYTVFGLTFEYLEFGNACFVEILSDNDHLVHVPIVLFEIIDDRVSSYWRIKQYSQGTVVMWPPSMFKEFYHDDLSEDVIEVVEDFKRIKEQILFEF